VYHLSETGERELGVDKAYNSKLQPPVTYWQLNRVAVPNQTRPSIEDCLCACCSLQMNAHTKARLLRRQDTGCVASSNHLPVHLDASLRPVLARSSVTASMV
jgi:hypothetical protein